MKAGTLDIIITKGCDFAGYVLVFKDEQGDEVQVSDWTFQAQARVALDKPVAFSLSVVPGDEPTQALMEPMTGAQTNALPAGEFGWDLVPIDADGKRLEPPLAGRIQVKAINSRPTS